MKKFLLFPIVLLFSGCFSLKTSLPQINYYDLDVDTKKMALNCKSSSRIGIAEIQTSSIYEKKEILLKKENGQISSIDGVAWIDSPKNLLKKILIKQFDANCLKTSLPPFGGVKNDFLLKIELLNFEVVQKQGKEFVQIALFYELSSLKNFQILDSGVISQKEWVKGNYIDTFSRAISKVGEKITKKLKNK